MTEPTIPRPKPRRARGLMDRRGPVLAVERGLIQRIARVYEDWGFEPLETPAFEYADALGKFLPDQDRPNEGVFAFEDDEEWVALRYDLTAPLARFVAENFDALPKPYRRWAAGPVWRNEKPGPGRYREFWQCDADTVGSASPAADAEMIMLAASAIEAVGIARGSYRVLVNNRKLLDGAMDAANIADGARLGVLRALDKLDRLGAQGVRALLGEGRKDESGDYTKGAGLAADQVDLLLAFPTIEIGDVPMDDTKSGGILWRASDEYGARATNAFRNSPRFTEGMGELVAIRQIVRASGFADDRVRFDFSIVRGLEYYTGAVFEAQLLTPSGAAFGSVGGGGRYDDLVARFRGERIPATGFSIGVSRLAAALEAQGAAEEDGPVVVLVMDQARVGDALAMANELRAAGVRAEAYLGAAGMKAQLKYADRRAAPVAVIQGGDELAKGVVTLKDLKLGSKVAADLGEDREAYAKSRAQVQLEVPRAQLVAAVQQMLAR